MVGIYDGTNTKVFLNGIQVGIGTISGLLKNPANLHIYLGRYFTFEGSIDEARIYNRALSKQEVLTLYLYSYSE